MDSGPRSLMIVGGQWGDEGKGKVVDLLSGSFAAVVRYNGGHNAGHTVRFADRRFALHLVPSGVIHDGVRCYLAAGMVIDPLALLTELDRLADEGVSTEGRVFLSPRATLILPTHRALDLAREGARGGGKIGTTGRGIGPAYADLGQRRALRAYLLAEPGRLAEQARAVMAEHNRELIRAPRCRARGPRRGRGRARERGRAGSRRCSWRWVPSSSGTPRAATGSCSRGRRGSSSTSATAPTPTSPPPRACRPLPRPRAGSVPACSDRSWGS